jgi:hypothetical protein
VEASSNISTGWSFKDALLFGKQPEQPNQPIASKAARRGWLVVAKVASEVAAPDTMGAGTGSFDDSHLHCLPQSDSRKPQSACATLMDVHLVCDGARTPPRSHDHGSPLKESKNRRTPRQ